MDEILWHRRESRRKQRRQTSSCSPRRLLPTRSRGVSFIKVIKNSVDHLGFGDESNDAKVASEICLSGGETSQPAHSDGACGAATLQPRVASVLATGNPGMLQVELKPPDTFRDIPSGHSR